jgi:hypothetical protein
MYTSKGNNDQGPQTYIAVGKDEKGESFSIIHFNEFLVKGDPNCKQPHPLDLVSTPHSNAFIDLDGDCMPDIFLQKE